jgi:hypothetical protein
MICFDVNVKTQVEKSDSGILQDLVSDSCRIIQDQAKKRTKNRCSCNLTSGRIKRFLQDSVIQENITVVLQ